MKKLSRKTVKIGTFTLIVTAIVTAVVIALNLFVGALPASVTMIDTSKEKIFTIGDETKALLDKITEEVTIYMFVEEGKETSASTAVEQLIKQYEGASSKIKYRVVDPAVSPNFSKQFTEETLSAGSVIVSCKTRSRVIKGDTWYMFETSQGRLTAAEYNRYAQFYYAYGQQFDAVEIFLGETNLTSAISYVTSENKSRIYSLTGHGELSLSGSFASIVSDANIAQSELSLIAGDGTIPDDCTLLIIDYPTKDISDAELETIKAYFDRGGAVMLATYVETFTAGAQPNVAALAAHAGMASVDGMVFEGDSRRYQAYPYNVIPSLSASCPEALWSDSALTYMAAYAHGIVEAEGADTDFFPLLSTSSLSYVKTDIYEIETLEREEGDAEGPFNTAAVSTKDTSGGTAKFIWYATPTLIDQNYDYGGNSELFKSIVKWTCEGDEVVSVSPKTVSNDYLTVTQSERNTVKFFLEFFIPFAILGAGIAVRLVRRRKR